MALGGGDALPSDHGSHSRVNEAPEHGLPAHPPLGLARKRELLTVRFIAGETHYAFIFN